MTVICAPFDVTVSLPSELKLRDYELEQLENWEFQGAEYYIHTRRAEEKNTLEQRVCSLGDRFVLAPFKHIKFFFRGISCSISKKKVIKIVREFFLYDHGFNFHNVSDELIIFNSWNAKHKTSYWCVGKFVSLARSLTHGYFSGGGVNNM